ncbi:SCO6745 family protein [Ilumatobacter sp.]|uniref:SCO6745 family protein n=1 Tax=Ilumatobacter sp. TaxID=1967498 RepID=UPI003C4E9F7A
MGSVAVRDLWRVIEPCHQAAYRTSETQAALSSIGLDDPELQYFGSRLCALGPIGAEVACAVLFGFAPSKVGGAIPLVWEQATPAAIAGARLDGATRTLRRVAGSSITPEDIASAAATVRAAALACDVGARPLCAAHLGLEWSDEPIGVLWQACTVLREHRGDSHWVVTVAEGLDAVECHVLHATDGHMPRDLLQRVTGWDDAAWDDGVDRLSARGLVADGRTTPDGAALKAEIEHRTDELASSPWQHLDGNAIQGMHQVLANLSAAMVAAGELPTWELRERLWRDLPPRPAPNRRDQ